MTTAYCITTDAAFFMPAMCAVESIRRQKDGGDLDIFLLCGPNEAPPDFAAIDARLGTRVKLIAAQFTPNLDRAPSANFSQAVYRRLFLDNVLPSCVTRIISLDADILVAGAGLAELARLDLRGHTIAAAYDMIFLKQFGGGELAERFRRHRAGLGLAPDTPYFNNGVVVIDRAAWRAQRLGERALEYVLSHTDACPFLEQDGLNAVLKGKFAPLSPRYNFMGDFFLLNLEAQIAPIIRHFVTRPKPWQTATWNHRTDISRHYRDFFTRAGRHGLDDDEQAALPPQTDVDWSLFRRTLLDWARSQDFIDAFSPGEFSPGPDRDRRISAYGSARSHRRLEAPIAHRQARPADPD